jgi:hypothetical protein
LAVLCGGTVGAWYGQDAFLMCLRSTDVGRYWFCARSIAEACYIVLFVCAHSWSVRLLLAFWYVVQEVRWLREVTGLKGLGGDFVLLLGVAVFVLFGVMAYHEFILPTIEVWHIRGLSYADRILFNQRYT